MEWENFVHTASSYLLLPAVYYRLKTLKLTSILPADLDNYLENFCSINYNRNVKLLDEARAVSCVLNENNIPHVFIKGIALLACNIYDSPGSRMIGDIDLLVKRPDIPKAMAVLKDFGYSKQIGFAYKNIGFRHEDRLVDKEKLAAVEIHNNILNAPHQNLIDPDDLFENSILESGLPVPNSTHNCMIQVLTYQINDKGYFFNRIYPKSLFDVHCLNIPKNTEALNILHKTKFGKAYLELYVYCMEGRHPKNKSLRLKFFILKQRYKFIDRLSHTVKYIYNQIIDRLYQFRKNPYYRKHTLKKVLKPRS